MSVPPEAIAQGVSPFAELMVCLPADWPVPAESYAVAPWEDDRAYFPIRGLKMLARLPHEYGTFLGFGHTIPNGDPAEPLVEGSQLCGWLLLPPVTLPEAVRSVTVPDGRRVDLFGIVGSRSRN